MARKMPERVSIPRPLGDQAMCRRNCPYSALTGSDLDVMHDRRGEEEGALTYQSDREIDTAPRTNGGLLICKETAVFR